MQHPSWLRQTIQTERLSNILTRPRSKNPGIYVIEQECMNFVRIVEDPDTTFPTALDFILYQLYQFYDIQVDCTEEMADVFNTGKCSQRDFERLIPIFATNGIKVYTLEAYIVEAFNLCVASTEAEELVETLMNVSKSNILLDMIMQYPYEGEFGINRARSIYWYIVRAFILYALCKGKSAFPLTPDNLCRAEVLSLYNEALSITATIPETYREYLELENKGGTVYGF